MQSPNGASLSKRKRAVSEHNHMQPKRPKLAKRCMSEGARAEAISSVSQHKVEEGVADVTAGIQSSRQYGKTMSAHHVQELYNLTMMLIFGRDIEDGFRGELYNARDSASAKSEEGLEEIRKLELKMILIQEEQLDRAHRLTRLVAEDFFDKDDTRFGVLPQPFFDMVDALANVQSQITDQDKKITALREQVQGMTATWEAVFQYNVEDEAELKPAFETQPKIEFQEDDGGLEEAREKALHLLTDAQNYVAWLRTSEHRAIDAMITSGRCYLEKAGTCPPTRKEEYQDHDPGRDRQELDEQPANKPSRYQQEMQRQVAYELQRACRLLKKAYEEFDDVRTGYDRRRLRHFAHTINHNASRTEYDLDYYLKRGEANHNVVQAEADLARYRSRAQAIGALPEDQITSNFPDKSDDGYAESLVGIIQDMVDTGKIERWVEQQPNTSIPAPEGLCDANADARTIKCDGTALTGSFVDSEEQSVSHGIRRKLGDYKKLQARWRKEASAQHAAWQAYQCLAPPSL